MSMTSLLLSPRNSWMNSRLIRMALPAMGIETDQIDHEGFHWQMKRSRGVASGRKQGLNNQSFSGRKKNAIPKMQ